MEHKIGWCITLFSDEAQEGSNNRDKLFLVEKVAKKSKKFQEMYCINCAYVV